MGIKEEKGILDNWRLGTRDVEETTIYFAVGEYKGNYLMTSKIERIDFTLKKIYTLNSIYKMGDYKRAN